MEGLLLLGGVGGGGLLLASVLVLCVQQSRARGTGPSSAGWKFSIATAPSLATTGSAVSPVPKGPWTPTPAWTHA